MVREICLSRNQVLWEWKAENISLKNGSCSFLEESAVSRECLYMREYTFEQPSPRRQKEDCSISWQMRRICHTRHCTKTQQCEASGAKVRAISEGTLNL